MRGLGLAILLTACSVMSEVEPTPGLAPLPTQPTSPLPMRASLPSPTVALETSVPPVKSSAVESARADLARRLKVDLGQIQVVSVAESEQPLQSSGCQPIGPLDPSIPAIVIGQEIRLAAGGKTYVYWVQKGRLMLCEGPDLTPSGSSESDVAVRAAIADLAARRKISPDKVQVVSVEAVDWPDTSLGCPQPGMFYAQIIVPGYRIVLSMDGKQVEYHADRKGRVVTCQ